MFSLSLSFARPHNVKRYNSAIPVLVIEHKKMQTKVRLTVEWRVYSYKQPKKEVENNNFMGGIPQEVKS